MIDWKPIQKRFVNGDAGFVGKYTFFKVLYDGATSRGDDAVYLLTCTLPGIKNNLGNFETRKEAKDRADKVLQHWLANTGLMEDDR